ncbi:hypothetical protein RQP46_006254 [Phenoliferia psychrophenolica]
MFISVAAITALAVSRSLLSASAVPTATLFKGWSTYKANGGAWLEIEKTYAGGVIPDAYSDEWSWCAAVGKAVCGPVLEGHYASYVTKEDIDRLARYGVNTVRILTTYAAWYDVPGSMLYHGNQASFFREIAEYAITEYDMHVVLGLHSLPGGVNGLDIGEAVGHLNWWHNETSLVHSLESYTFSPINEPSDNTNMSELFTPQMVSNPDGVTYLDAYMKAVYALMKIRSMENTLMVTDTYAGPSFWAPYWAPGSNIVIDTHIYYFAPPGVTGALIPELACAKAKNSTTSFPVFVGEFTTQATLNNSLSLRPKIFQTQLYAFQKYLSGATMWNVKYLDTDKVTSGEGNMADYWSFESLIEAGAVNPGGALTQVMVGC